MKANKLAIGAIIGAAVGVAAGILTAPKSGKETRDDIKQKAGDAKRKAASTKDDLIFKAEETADDIRQMASDKLKSLKNDSRKK